MTLAYDGVPKMLTDEKEHRRKMAEMLTDRVNRGKINCTKTSVTLTANATSTTLIDERLGAYTYIDFMPTTANAAAAKASIYITNQLKGQCTINHASSANVDQTFTVVMFA